MAVDQDNGQVDPSVPENYEHLLEDYSQFAPPAADEVVQGTVLGITAKDVIVDFGYKSEGIVPIEQFYSPAGEVTVKRGDVVDVMIDRSEQVAAQYPGCAHTGLRRRQLFQPNQPENSGRCDAECGGTFTDGHLVAGLPLSLTVDRNRMVVA